MGCGACGAKYRRVVRTKAQAIEASKPKPDLGPPNPPKLQFPVSYAPQAEPSNPEKKGDEGEK